MRVRHAIRPFQSSSSHTRPRAPRACQTDTTAVGNNHPPSTNAPRTVTLPLPTYPNVGLAVPITGGSRPRRRGNILGRVLAELLEDIRARHCLLHHGNTSRHKRRAGRRNRGRTRPDPHQYRRNKRRTDMPPNIREKCQLSRWRPARRQHACLAAAPQPQPQAHSPSHSAQQSPSPLLHPHRRRPHGLTRNGSQAAPTHQTLTAPYG